MDKFKAVASVAMEQSVAMEAAPVLRVFHSTQTAWTVKTSLVLLTIALCVPQKKLASGV